MAMALDERRHELLQGRRFVGDAESAGHVAEMLKAVAHPHRLRIIDLLCVGEHHVSAIVAQLGLPQAIVSQQLRILRMQRLVQTRRHGGHTYYRISEPRLVELVACLSGCPRSDGD